MTDLISRQAAIEAVGDVPYIKEHPNVGLLWKAWIESLPSAQPTIDAEPVRHGKWIDIDEQTYTWKIRCSCCGNERSMLSTQGKYPNYCEACGARMDAERKEE